MAKAKPKPYDSACKCRRCSGKGTVYSQESFSGRKGGRYKARTCPKCWGVGWNPPQTKAAAIKAIESIADEHHIHVRITP